MRYMPLDFVKPHHYLAQPIYNRKFVEQLFDDGHLTPARVESLKRLGYHSVFVREYDKPDVANALEHQMLSAVYSRVAALNESLEKIAATWQPDKQVPLPLESVRKLDAIIIDLDQLGEALSLEMLRQKHPVLHLYESKSLFLYNVQHAVHTALIAVRIGLKKDLNIKALKNLFLGALLQDIGYIFLKEFNIEKIGLLSHESRLAQQTHVRYTHALLSQLQSVNGIVRNICLQHHEREDGSGYPMGLRSPEINPLAKILTLAISFDALVSDRPFRPAYPAHKAIAIIQQGSGKHFDSHCVELLVKAIPPFPLGTYISYNKRVGIVYSYDATHRNPVIQFEDGNQASLSELSDGPVGLNYQA